MLDIIKIIILGIVQGVAEFLPISSTGHLILLEKLFNISQETYGLAFDAALHIGTLLAILWFFRYEWVKLFYSFIRIIQKQKIQTDSEKLVILLILATIPGALFGILLEKKVETMFRSPILVGLTLIIFSLVLIYVEKFGKKNKTIKQMNWKDGIITGLAQAIALIPGVSRSGITIAAGMWEGLTREEAAKFTFLLSAPIVFGAGGKKLFDVVKLAIDQQLPTTDMGLYIIGMLTAAVFGYLTIKYLLQYLSNHSLWLFIIYRIILGVSVLLVLI